MSTTDVDAWLRDASDIDGAKVIVQQADVADSKDFRALGDQVRDKLGSGVAVLASPSDGKLTIMVLVSDDLVSRGVKAGDIIRPVGALVDAKGGGRPHMAQAGGGDASKIANLLAEAPGLVTDALRS